MNRRLAAVAVLTGLALAVAPSASAQVLPTKTYTTTTPLRIVVAGPTSRLTVPLVSTVRAPMHATASLALTGDRVGEAVVASSGQAGAVDVTIRSVDLVVGSGQVVEVLDDLDPGAPVLRIPLAVVRQSRVSVDQVASWPGGFVVTGRALHYDVPTGTYRPDLSSPVQVRTSRDGGKTWKVAATYATSPDGSIAAVVNGQSSPTGKMLVRLVRPAGSTVTGGASKAYTVTVGKKPVVKPAPARPGVVKLS